MIPFLRHSDNNGAMVVEVGVTGMGGGGGQLSGHSKCIYLLTLSRE